MALFNSESIPQTHENTIDDYVILNTDNGDSHTSKRFKIYDMPISRASEDNFGGVKVGFTESTEDDGLYALRVEDGNGYFTVQWTDKVILSAQYNPQLSAIQIEIVDKQGETKIVNVDVAGLVDDYWGDGRTLEQNDNTFSTKEGVFLPNGNYASSSAASSTSQKNQLVLFRNNSETHFMNQMFLQDSYSEITTKNRLYYIKDDKAYFYSQPRNQIIPLLRPIDM